MSPSAAFRSLRPTSAVARPFGPSLPLAALITCAPRPEGGDRDREKVTERDRVRLRLGAPPGTARPSIVPFYIPLRLVGAASPQASPLPVRLSHPGRFPPSSGPMRSVPSRPRNGHRSASRNITDDGREIPPSSARAGPSLEPPHPQYTHRPPPPPPSAVLGRCCTERKRGSVPPSPPGALL